MKLLSAFLRGKSRAPRAADIATISDTIDRALSAAGLKPAGPAPRTPPGAARDTASTTARSTPATKQDVPDPARARRTAHVANGASSTRTFRNAAGTRDYTLYVPATIEGSASRPMPLVVMLHGCTQSPQDFATGTGMNALADAHGLLVAYPAQAPRDNGSRCWNWFRPQDQARDTGEPAILAGIVDDIARTHAVDRSRVYVAGLSAGAAMAVILGRTYPDVFAAVGVHSGLPYAAARDVPGAFAAMQSSAFDRHGKATPARPGVTTPTIVFHGEADRTVHPANGRAVMRDALGGEAIGASLRASRREGEVAGGRAYTVDVYADASGAPKAELWSVAGAGHAWSGGAAEGSYTDPDGPDASAEMVRFFLTHRNVAHAA